VLFIFETVRPQKYLLKIIPTLQQESENIYDIIPDLDEINEVLNRLIPLPEQGSLKTLTRNQRDILVLLWKFDTTTACSHADDKNFANVTSLQRFWELPTLPYPNATIFWPFFILKSGCPKPFGNMYPQVSENQRFQALTDSLKTQLKNDCKSLNFPTYFDAYCRFSGGGDLCIKKAIKPPFVQPLLVVTPRDNEEQSKTQ